MHPNDFIYIANQFPHQIYTISPGGVIGVYAGTGVCFNSANELFVIDYGNNLIRKIDGNGNVTTFAGSGAAASIDGMDLTSGVYYMNILTEKGLINKRFVKE